MTSPGNVASVFQFNRIVCIKAGQFHVSLQVGGEVFAGWVLALSHSTSVPGLEPCEGEHHHRQPRRGRDQGEPEEDLPLERSELTDVVQDLVIVQARLLSVFVRHII